MSSVQHFSHLCLSLNIAPYDPGLTAQEPEELLLVYYRNYNLRISGFCDNLS